MSEDLVKVVMNVHEGLSKIKFYDKRIDRILFEGAMNSFIIGYKKSAEKIGTLSIKELDSRLKRNHDMVTALIDNK